MWAADLLGDSLKGKDGELKTAEHLKDKYVGLYFSAHWCGPCRNFTPKLIETYKTIVGKGEPFEIVFVSSDRDEKSFNDYHESMPWVALPWSAQDIAKKVKQKFQVTGIPSFVILEKDGAQISANSRSAVMKDPAGENFPWRPKPLSELIKGKYRRGKEEEVTEDAFKGKYLCFYFSAHWCPPCKMFTPELARFYNRRKGDKNDIEIVFVSSDKSEDQFEEYYASMPWLALPFKDERTMALSERFAVGGIPSLVILDENLKVMTDDGTSGVRGDPNGTAFPYCPVAVSSLEYPGVSNFLSNIPTVVLLMEGMDDEAAKDLAVEAMQPIAEELFSKTGADDREMAFVHAKDECWLADRIREMLSLGAPKNEPTVVLLELQNQCYYKGDTGDVASESAFRSFVERYRAGTLKKEALS
eukprot:Rmarinus@m.17245